ncbi:MAG: hypothetical protein ABIM98_07445 [candidate division WOR-3 bacterium]
MKYSQAFETIFEPVKAEFPGIIIKEVKGIIPPIRNKQKWFVIRKQDQISKIKEHFEDIIEEIIRYLHADDFPFFPVFEWRKVVDNRGVIDFLLEGVYFLDFNIPIDEAYKFKSSNNIPLPYEYDYRFSIYRKRYLPGALLIHEVPVIYYFHREGIPLSANITFENIKKTIQEGHFLSFMLGDYLNNISLSFSFPSKVTFVSRPNADYFFYTKGKIKHCVREISGTTEYAIDNFFLFKFEKVLPLMLSILTQFPKTFGATFVKDKLLLKIMSMVGEIHIEFDTIFDRILETLKPIGCYVNFWKKTLRNKLDFLYGIESIAKYMWFKIFGEAITFPGNLDAVLKEIEDRMLFIRETLSFIT